MASVNDQIWSFEWLSVHAKSGHRTGPRAHRQEGHPFSKPVSVDKPHDVAGIIMAHVAQHIKPKIGPAYPSGSWGIEGAPSLSHCTEIALPNSQPEMPNKTVEAWRCRTSKRRRGQVQGATTRPITIKVIGVPRKKAGGPKRSKATGSHATLPLTCPKSSRNVEYAMVATALPNTADIRARLKNSFASRLITDVIRRSKAKRYHINGGFLPIPA